MLVVRDEKVHKRVVEFSEEGVMKALEDEVRAKLNLSNGANVQVTIDVSSHGLLRGATVEVTEKL